MRCFFFLVYGTKEGRKEGKDKERERKSKNKDRERERKEMKTVRGRAQKSEYCLGK